ITTGAIFQYKGDVTRCTSSGNRGRRKGERNPLRHLNKKAIEPRFDFRVEFALLLAILPRLKGHEKKSAVGALHSAQKTGPNGGRNVLDTRAISERRFNFAPHLLGSLQCCGIRQLQ